MYCTSDTYERICHSKSGDLSGGKTPFAENSSSIPWNQVMRLCSDTVVYIALEREAGKPIFCCASDKLRMAQKVRRVERPYPAPSGIDKLISVSVQTEYSIPHENYDGHDATSKEKIEITDHSRPENPLNPSIFWDADHLTWLFEGYTSPPEVKSWRPMSFEG
jgi:hypothetical protein